MLVRLTHRLNLQGAVTKEGPIQNLLTFVEDPKHNVFSYLE